MTLAIHSAVPRGRVASRRANALCSRSRELLLYCIAASVGCGWFSAARAQAAAAPGGQRLAFAGLRAAQTGGIPAGQINAVTSDSTGNIYLLIDRKDGVRLLKMDAAAGTVLAEAQLGAKGDIGLAMALDPSGNVYVTGTSWSGALNATAGAAFPASTGSATNGFVAKFDADLNTDFVTFAGGGYMSASAIAATADAVFIAGSIFSPTLPVTPQAVMGAPASGTTGNGFVEKFSGSGSTLLYATYLTGAGGNTSAVALAADSSDDAYVGGYTAAPGFPTVAAVVPEMLGTASGFLTKLKPGGDGIAFSTFIPGSGVTSLAADAGAGNLLVSGGIALGQFPVSTVQVPLVPMTYQVLLRLPFDGSTVLSSTALAPGNGSLVAAGPPGTAWVTGDLAVPLLAVPSLSSIGNSYAARVSRLNQVDQTARFGGVAAGNTGYASAPVTLTGVAVNSAGTALIGGSFSPTASSSLLTSQTFDLPLESAPTNVFSSEVRAAVLPSSACDGSLCAGSSAYFAELIAPGTAAAVPAALALSVDDAPNVTLRNLSTADATGLQIMATGFTQVNNCGAILSAGGECSIALSGVGPGSITASSDNATTQTRAIPDRSGSAVQAAVVFSPKELDFGIVSAAGPPVVRTITVTNLMQGTQTFNSVRSFGNAKSTPPYTVTEEATDCTLAGSTTRVLAPGASCHITISVAASSNSADDGVIHANWIIGGGSVGLTAYSQAAALSVSAAEIDFGTQYTNGLRLPRYLYLSNSAGQNYSHAPIVLPGGSPFAVYDACPRVLAPHSVCQIMLEYQALHAPSSDSVTLMLDQGLNVLVTGRTLNQPTSAGATANPNMSVSATSLSFATPVVVTGTSSSTQAVTVKNTGVAGFAVAVSLTGDYTQSTNCGAMLTGGASCSVVLTFAPSAPGTRSGLLVLSAGGGAAPAYVTLTGSGVDILSPPTNGTIDMGAEPLGQPVVEWFKVTQPFTSFSAAAASPLLGAPFTAVLVEDIGYGHGQPSSSAFSNIATGSCYNCWLGVRFDPTTTGLATGTLTLRSVPGGSSEVLSLTGAGNASTGLLLTPASQDFGSVAINSSSAASLFVLTNLSPTQSAVTLATPTVSGDFSISNSPTGGVPCGGALAYTASCFVQVVFAPAAVGARSGALTIQAGPEIAVASLTGYGESDPGVALNPAALLFADVPGAGSTQQTVTVTNTGAAGLSLATPTVLTTSSAATSFVATSNCGTLDLGASCTVQVTFAPTSAPAAGILSIPVTTTVAGSPVLTNYTVPLTGAYTSSSAGLELLPGALQYGPLPTGSMGVSRQVLINNLSGKGLALQVSLPHQFVLAGAPCTALAAGASCVFSVAFLPLTNGAVTGTIVAFGAPSDGSAGVSGAAYLEGYGNGQGSLVVSGGLLPGTVLDFGQVPSGQAMQKVLTLTNSSSNSPVTVRRITSQPPFTAISTCGETLAPAASCTITARYTPLNENAAGVSTPPSRTDTGALLIESDSTSSPDTINLTGSVTPVTVSTPSTVTLPTLTASQGSLTFSPTQAGDLSAPQVVTLTNSGTGAVEILNVQGTPDFMATSDCSTVLPGAHCTVTVAFSPQAGSPAGAASNQRAGAVHISSSAMTPLDFLSVVGVATASTLTLSQTSLDFGRVQVGDRQSLGLQLSNSGATALTLGQLTAGGDYTVSAGSCPSPVMALAPGASCTLQVAFAPSATGTRPGALDIASSASTLPLAVSLTGLGVQSQLQVSPAKLDFGALPTGAAASLSLTLANTGNSPITGISLQTTSGFAVSTPCAVATLAPGGSCSVTLTFSPLSAGAQTGTLKVLSSDSGSPVSIALTGTGTASGMFTLTVGGSNSGVASVKTGRPASYSLAITPVNGFSGSVVLNCTPMTPADFAYCSLLPSTVTVGGAAQGTVATIETVTSIANSKAEPVRGFGRTAVCLLFPALLFSWKARTSRERLWRRTMPVAWAVFATFALLTSSGCAGSGADPNLRYATPGTYQYQVTASSVGAATQVTQTVTLNLTITP